jgi:hypothetical protein
MNNVEHKENEVVYPPNFFSIKLFSLPWMSKRPLNTKLSPAGQASGHGYADAPRQLRVPQSRVQTTPTLTRSKQETTASRPQNFHATGHAK